MAKSTNSAKSDIRWEIKGLLLICFGILGVFSIYTKAVGSVGHFISKNIKGFSGQAAVFIPFLIIFLGIYCFYYKKKPNLSPRLIGLIIIFTILDFLLHLKIHTDLLELSFLDRLRRSADIGANGQGGGILGEIGLSLLISIFGKTGTLILMITFVIIGIILITGKSLAGLIKKMRLPQKRKTISINPTIKDDKIKVLNANMTNILGNDDNKNTENQSNKVSDTHDTELNGRQEKQATISEDSLIISEENDDENDYKLPPISLLRKNTGKPNIFSEKELLDKAHTLEKTLESFGVQAKVIQVNCGPTITRFELHPSPGIKVSRIVNLADDIALSLAASDVRIEAPIPGKAAIGIEVPNKINSVVYLRDILESTEFKNSTSKLTIALGKDIGGNPIVTDLFDMPHLLIAGATGSGKSVCINTIISSILYKALPSEVRLMMIDPKMVELAVYDGIPHLLTPVVTDAKKASMALNWIVLEMERRYQTFANEGVRDITRYNEINKEKPIPKVVVIIDELADLMMVSPREVEDSICRIAQMARAAGIHLVVATQRPSVDIITGLIKANIPSRISFAVSSQVDSRTILDASGAEKLLGKGDMLFFPVGASKPTRIQGVYMSEEEVEQLVNYIKKQKQPTYEKNLSDFEEKEMEKKDDDTDELFREAVSVVMDSGQASISMLQRRLRIGYTRAARLIDQMEERGFVGGYEGTKPREILITREYFEKYFSS